MMVTVVLLVNVYSLALYQHERVEYVPLAVTFCVELTERLTDGRGTGFWLPDVLRQVRQS